MTDEILNMRVLGEISEQLGHDIAQMLLTRYEDEANALMTLLNSQQGKDAPVEDLIKDIHKNCRIICTTGAVRNARQIKHDRGESKSTGCWCAMGRNRQSEHTLDRQQRCD